MIGCRILAVRTPEFQRLAGPQTERSAGQFFRHAEVRDARNDSTPEPNALQRRLRDHRATGVPDR